MEVWFLGLKYEFLGAGLKPPFDLQGPVRGGMASRNDYWSTSDDRTTKIITY
jgi:hypothetical protein